MARRRLTASTLDTVRTLSIGGKAVDIVARLLGSGATDREIVATGRFLRKAAGDKGIETLHRLASRIAAEAGEDFPNNMEDESPNDPRNTQDYVAEHEVTPDHAVMDVVLNERKPTQNPTARRRAKDDAEPELEDPNELENDEEDFVDDDLEDENGSASEVVEDDEIDEEDEDEIDEEDGDEEDGDEEDGDEEAGDDEEDGDKEDDGVDSYDHKYDDDEDDSRVDEDDNEGEFTIDDMEKLEDLGVDGVLTSSKKRPRKASKKFRPSRTRVASQEDNEFNSVWGQPDVSGEFDA